MSLDSVGIYPRLNARRSLSTLTSLLEVQFHVLLTCARVKYVLQRYRRPFVYTCVVSIRRACAGLPSHCCLSLGFLPSATYVYFIQEQHVIGSARQTSRRRGFSLFSPRAPQVATENTLYQEIMISPADNRPYKSTVAHLAVTFCETI